MKNISKYLYITSIIVLIVFIVSIVLIVFNVIQLESNKRKQRKAQAEAKAKAKAQAQAQAQRLIKFINKNLVIIKIKSKKNCYGFPHFVHTMEYFYNLSEIIITNQSNFVVVIEPTQKYKSTYVVSYLNLFLSLYDNFIFMDNTLFLNYFPNKEYEFNHDKLKESVNFSFNKEIFHGEILSWFQNKSTSDIIRKSFFPQDKSNGSNNKIKIGLVNRKNTRILLNMNEICEKIKDKFGIIVETTYFENKSFQEQISFFNTHNIIISPHGAQLCSIPFSPKNALIIECCHEEWHPYYYFPGLSMTSSKIHVMLCDNHSVFPKWCSPQYSGGQRKYNINTDPEKIITIIQSYINGDLNNKQIYLM